MDRMDPVEWLRETTFKTEEARREQQNLLRTSSARSAPATRPARPSPPAWVQARKEELAELLARVEQQRIELDARTKARVALVVPWVDDYILKTRRQRLVRELDTIEETWLSEYSLARGGRRLENWEETLRAQSDKFFHSTRQEILEWEERWVPFPWEDSLPVLGPEKVLEALEPVAEPLVEPVVEPTAEPVAEPVAEPEVIEINTTAEMSMYSQRQPQDEEMGIQPQDEEMGERQPQGEEMGELRDMDELEEMGELEEYIEYEYEDMDDLEYDHAEPEFEEIQMDTGAAPSFTGFMTGNQYETYLNHELHDNFDPIAETVDLLSEPEGDPEGDFAPQKPEIIELESASPQQHIYSPAGDKEFGEQVETSIVVPMEIEPVGLEHASPEPAVEPAQALEPAELEPASPEPAIEAKPSTPEQVLEPAEPAEPVEPTSPEPAIEAQPSATPAPALEPAEPEPASPEPVIEAKPSATPAQALEPVEPVEPTSHEPAIEAQPSAISPTPATLELAEPASPEAATETKPPAASPPAAPSAPALPRARIDFGFDITADFDLEPPAANTEDSPMDISEPALNDPPQEIPDSAPLEPTKTQSQGYREVSMHDMDVSFNIVPEFNEQEPNETSFRDDHIIDPTYTDTSASLIRSASKLFGRSTLFGGRAPESIVHSTPAPRRRDPRDISLDAKQIFSKSPLFGGKPPVPQPDFSTSSPRIDSITKARFKMGKTEDAMFVHPVVVSDKSAQSFETAGFKETSPTENTRAQKPEKPASASAMANVPDLGPKQPEPEPVPEPKPEPEQVEEKTDSTRETELRRSPRKLSTTIPGARSSSPTRSRSPSKRKTSGRGPSKAKAKEPKEETPEPVATPIPPKDEIHVPRTRKKAARPETAELETPEQPQESSIPRTRKRSRRGADTQEESEPKKTKGKGGSAQKPTPRRSGRLKKK